VVSLEQWETFYQGGALATGPAGEDGLYDQEVRQAWTEFFAALPVDARILDIGTGNGVIVLIAGEVAAARGARWEIHGTDLARIDPLRDVADGARRFAGATFHPGVATERLPFADASFDAVSGHYALEYSDIPAALAQIHRVLKPGGDAQFVLHHVDSALLRTARRSMREADLVLEETRIYRRLHRLVSMDQPPKATMERATDELVAAIRQLKQELALAQAQHPGAGRMLGVALDAVQKLLAARRDGRPEGIGLEVDRAEEEMRAARRRLSDLVGHARSAEDMANIQRDAVAVGFSLVEFTPLDHAVTNLVGWQLLLHRP
jgi:ubiquinone/menaquinone biosynthesis C-methylase UbiE